MSPNPRSNHRAPVSRISRSRALIRTSILSLVAALVIFGGLTLQMAMGDDPAIGTTDSGRTTGTAQAANSNTEAEPETELSAPTVLVPPDQPTAAALPEPTPVQTSVS